ncbi:MAG TPA: hypothetical protein VMZ91_02200 [Candidatus Paceibacterota bacterium]|nr:hypothetical protein [Candidatus Paceibacterota bacterium]
MKKQKKRKSCKDKMEIISIVPYIGFGHNLIRRTLDAGKETQEAREVRVQKALEDARKKVPPVYNSKGKLVEYNNDGRHLINVKA